MMKTNTLYQQLRPKLCKNLRTTSLGQNLLVLIKKKRVPPPRKDRGEAGGGDSRGFIKFPDNFENAKISKTQFAAFSDQIRPRYKFPDIF